MKKLLLSLFAIVAAVLMVPGHAPHAEALHYSVSAQIPANQVDKNVSYFALKVTPGTTQDLGVTISNSDSAEHTYRVSVNRAATNTNGVVDYSKRGIKKPSSLTADVEAMTPSAFTIKVPAKSSKVAVIKLTVPTKPFAGLALGGVRVAELDTTKTTTKSKGLSLNNKFAYVIGLALQEDATYDNIAPDMTLHSVNAKQINYRNYISANLENTKPNMMRKLKITAKVSKQGSSDPIFSTTKSDMAMAPNSDFAFPISTKNNPLQPGDYTLDLNAWASGGKYHWHFTKNFTITAAEANKLNKTAVELKKTKPNYLLWILIAIGILILLLLLLILFLLFKRRKKDDDEDENAQ